MTRPDPKMTMLHKRKVKLELLGEAAKGYWESSKGKGADDAFDALDALQDAAEEYGKMFDVARDGKRIGRKAAT